jgi:FlaA1/EpsC-like NDP-sugar epimerase
VRDIEPEDLLGREPVQLDEAGIGRTVGAHVLITGAGGSIGSELCRQVARFGPARLVLIELSEFNLYSIEQELASASPGAAGAPDRRREGCWRACAEVFATGGRRWCSMPRPTSTCR